MDTKKRKTDRSSSTGVPLKVSVSHFYRLEDSRTKGLTDVPPPVGVTQ